MSIDQQPTLPRAARSPAAHAPRIVERGDLLGMLLDPLAAELAAVNEIFERELASDLACVNTLVRHVGRFRGKMLRPMLLLLAGKAVAPDRPLSNDALTLAAVVEMVHMSTLVHDDVLDEAELRRKGATINHLRGNEAAVLLGDYLISHSYHLCSSVTAPPPYEPQWAARVIGRTTNRLCEGELLQIDNRNNLAIDEPTYFEIIRRKTGELTAASSLLGAAFSGADEALAGAMHRYGLLVGVAFQVQDDVLDLVGETARVGKTLGLDVEKQKLTLPLIHFLRTAPQRHRELLKSLLRSGDPDKVEKIRNLVLPGGSIRYAQEEARRMASEATECLSGLPEGEWKRALEGICTYVVARQY
jgi:octaprenyl-diphosphate synthase